MKLGKRATDVLLDRSPAALVAKLELLLNQSARILRYHDLRVRPSRTENFIEVTIHLQPGLTLEKAHRISHLIEQQIIKADPGSFVHVHIEPDKQQVESLPDME